MHSTAAGVIGIVMAAVLLAGLGDVLAHPTGTNAAFTGLNGLAGSTYKAASGGYSTPGG